MIGNGYRQPGFPFGWRTLGTILVVLFVLFLCRVSPQVGTENGHGTTGTIVKGDGSHNLVVAN